MSVELSPAHVGQFVCSLTALGKLIGLPDHVQIRDVCSVPYAVHGEQAVRIVVEDKVDLPEVRVGDEITNVTPQFKLGGGTYREFTGWQENQ